MNKIRTYQTNDKFGFSDRYIEGVYKFNERGEVSYEQNFESDLYPNKEDEYVYYASIYTQGRMLYVKDLGKREPEVWLRLREREGWSGHQKKLEVG